MMLFVRQLPMLWKLLQPIVFKILAHFGHGLMYYMCRQKACTDPLTVSGSRTHRGLWNCHCFCEFMSKWINLCYTPFQANVKIIQTARVWHTCGQSPLHYWALLRRFAAFFQPTQLNYPSSKRLETLDILMPKGKKILCRKNHYILCRVKFNYLNIHISLLLSIVTTHLKIEAGLGVGQ